MRTAHGFPRRRSQNGGRSDVCRWFARSATDSGLAWRQHASAGPEAFQKLLGEVDPAPGS